MESLDPNKRKTRDTGLDGTYWKPDAPNRKRQTVINNTLDKYFLKKEVDDLSSLVLDIV